jgi:cell division protein FtsN
MNRTYRPASLQRQQGNTLTGIIIGLIIGLVIAVIVALVITKGSSPFTDKSGHLDKMGEPSPNQSADPNKPLYGNKDAARAANREITERQKAADAAAAPADGAQPANPAVPADAAKADAKPATEPAKPAATAAAGAAEPAGDEKVTYYLQAGAFREMADAENTRAKLALLGFEAAISDRTSDTGVLHRVRIGPFTQAEAMTRARAKLLDNGIDVAIVKNQK